MNDLLLNVAVLFFGIVATYLLTNRKEFIRPNFRGKRIPTAFGMAFVVAAALRWAFLASQSQMPGLNETLCFVVVVGFGVLGVIDDAFGDRSVGGLKGHIGGLVRGRITTGAVKAVGGGALALAVGWEVRGATFMALIAAILIAGSANCLNLIDLRPGRSLAAFLAASVPVIVIVTLRDPHWLNHGAVMLGVISAACLFVRERDAKFMIGDTGANAFGAILGLEYALLFPAWTQITAAALIVAFHVWTERHSFSKLIENTPALRRIDRKIGIR